MAITLEATSLGLLINTGVADSKMVSMTDFQELFTLFDENPNLQDEIKTELVRRFTELTDGIIQSLDSTTVEESHFIDIRSMQMWLISIQQYATQVAPQYRQFKAAIEAARNSS